MAIFDLNEAAAFLRCHPTMLLKVIEAESAFPCAKLGEDYRFIQADLEEWVRSHYTAEARGLLDSKSVRIEGESHLFAREEPRTFEEQVNELLGSEPKRKSNSRRRQPRSDKSVEEVLSEIQARKVAKKRDHLSTT